MRSVYTTDMKQSLILAAFAFFLFVLPSAASAHDEEKRMCTMQYNPVCGIKAGVYATYGNSCMLGVEGAAFVHEGECTDKEEISNGPEKPYVPPKGCTAWYDGCNSCSRGEDGQTACTLRACIGEPAPGYCTRYEDAPSKPAPAPTPNPGANASGSVNAAAGVPSASVDAEASTTVSANPGEVRVGFFGRVWASVSSFFLNLF